MSGLRDELTRCVLSLLELSRVEPSLEELSLLEFSFEELSVDELCLAELSFDEPSDFDLSSFFESLPLSDAGACDLLA